MFAKYLPRKSRYSSSACERTLTYHSLANSARRNCLMKSVAPQNARRIMTMDLIDAVSISKATLRNRHFNIAKENHSTSYDARTVAIFWRFIFAKRIKRVWCLSKSTTLRFTLRHSTISCLILRSFSNSMFIKISLGTRHSKDSLITHDENEIVRKWNECKLYTNDCGLGSS